MVETNVSLLSRNQSSFEPDVCGVRVEERKDRERDGIFLVRPSEPSRSESRSHADGGHGAAERGEDVACKTSGRRGGEQADKGGNHAARASELEFRKEEDRSLSGIGTQRVGQAQVLILQQRPNWTCQRAGRGVLIKQGPGGPQRVVWERHRHGQGTE